MGKLSILDTRSECRLSQVAKFSAGASGFRFLALTLVLGKDCLADNRDNAVETNTLTHTHTHTHTGATERKSHRGNSQLCAVNEKPACQDVPHSWMNKRGSGPRSPLGDTAGMRLLGKGNRMMETDREPFLTWPTFELSPPASPSWTDFASGVSPFPPRPVPSTSTSVCFSSCDAAVDYFDQQID